MLRGDTPFALREDIVAKRERREKRAALATPEGADEALLAALKALRGALAKAQNQPAYVVFPDRSLIEMAAAKPMSLDDLARIHGVGAAKLQKYGVGFPRRHSRARRCLNCPKSRRCGAGSRRLWLARASPRSRRGAAICERPSRRASPNGLRAAGSRR